MREYISELVDISIRYSLSLYILPVPPHAKRPSKRGRWRNRQRRRKACTLFNDSLRKQCANCKNINNATLHYLDFITPSNAATLIVFLGVIIFLVKLTKYIFEKKKH